MPKSLHPATRRRLASIGPSVRTWRRIQGLTASDVADRAGVSRPTLRTIETDPANVSFSNVFAVLSVLGLDADVAHALDPMESPRGKALVRAQAERGQR